MNYQETEILSQGSIKVNNHLPKIGIAYVKEEILRGLSSSPKYISSKFFYDKKGSKLFEAITELDEYYPTRAEKRILSTFGGELNIDFRDLNIIELGSGDHSKISLLLNQIPDSILPTIKYFPVDISKSAILCSAEILAEEFPMLEINGVVADFIHQLDLAPIDGRKLYCFFGSTIGNLLASEMKDFLKKLGDQMNPGDSFLLGLDMVKDIGILERAYNDDQGITGEFNRNILNVVNKLVGTNFETNNFEHLSFYDPEKKRIEMHLKALKDMDVTIDENGYHISIKKGERIHTEHSHKFTRESINTMAEWAGLDTKAVFTDTRNWFSLVLYVKK